MTGKITMLVPLIRVIWITGFLVISGIPVIAETEKRVISEAEKTIPKPTGAVVLVVKGDLAVSNSEEGLELDREMLAEIDDTSFRTSTIWTSGITEFRGTRFRVLLEWLGVKDGTLLLEAANDYLLEVPVEEMLTDDALIAFEQDGEEMSLRDKGPLWIVYPFDQERRYQNEVYFSRSIWQLLKMEFLAPGASN